MERAPLASGEHGVLPYPVREGEREPRTTHSSCLKPAGFEDPEASLGQSPKTWLE